MPSRFSRMFMGAALLCVCAAAVSQQSTALIASTTAEDDSLLQSRRLSDQPSRRLHLGNLGTLSIRNGDDSTEPVSAIVARSFAEQDTFAQRMNNAELVSAAAIAALPEVDDEVLIYPDAIVVHRSTTIVVIKPQEVAEASGIFADYLGKRGRQSTGPDQGVRRVISRAADLDAEERAGLRAFMRSGIDGLHPRDPLREAAARGEQAVLDAIIAGKGQWTIEDTLIIPTESGIDPGGTVAIPTVRNGILDLRNPEPVQEMAITGLAVPGPEPDPDPAPSPGISLKARPVQPAKPPRRQPLQPKQESSGKASITAEFLLGVTRAANFQWERKWTYTSGFFRLTLGSGYAFGYRVPVLATAGVEPTRGFIRDYSDKKVIIGAAASARTLNGNAGFYRNAGLAGKLVKQGDELLLAANVGFGYKFRAFWKTISSRPYTAVGVSLSQSFTPPNDPNGLQGMMAGDAFGVTLDPKTTQAIVKTTFVDGSAAIRFDGKAWGDLAIDLQTLVDGKVQNTFPLNTHINTAVGFYPYKITLDPKPLRQGTTRQTRSFGVRLANPEYRAHLVVMPQIKFGFRVGYKKLSANFSTAWIPLNSLTIDTGNFTMKRHPGTRSNYTWNEGEKVYQWMEKPNSGTVNRIQQ